MIKYKGAYESDTGSAYCLTCGTPQQKWEKISVSTENGVLVYLFKCKKCHKTIRMEIYHE